MEQMPVKNKSHENMPDNKLENMIEFISKVVDEAEKFNIKESDKNEKGELLVSPNGPVSNLGRQSELWWKIARTESFKKFFGDWQNNSKSSSKVVDRNGEPLVVFRAIGLNSLADFYNEDFYTKNSGLHGPGVYFTADPNRFHSGSTFPAFINSRKPIGSGFAMALRDWKGVANFLVPKKIGKFFGKISPSIYDSVFVESKKKAEDTWEMVLKSPYQVLMIPNPIKRISKSVKEYPKN